ncbi:MAG TPA: methylenetetrahydrofolate reductase [NAD(P)H] [Solirubrobacterales bacterium]|nr:methylenetetrahydrofolate reductase [NAD(P)H] [Solirubrobacterales bacterium]
MRIAELLERQRPVFSFEFFPPKTDEGEQTLQRTLEVLKDDQPDFVSVTYGAGGATRNRTVEITKSIKRDLGIEAMAHLSCVGEPRERLVELLAEIQAAGIENVLALRGDPPRGETEWKPHPGGLSYSVELITLIRERFDFCVGAAGFPEIHLDAPDRASDLRYAREKVEAGADFLVTQLFFDNDAYFGYVEDARQAGIHVPIIPGIMPITNYGQIRRFTEMCGATIPEDLEQQLNGRADDPEAVAELGVAYATLQCSDLLARGAPGIHFYTLNRSTATRAILAALRAAHPWTRAKAPV